MEIDTKQAGEVGFLILFALIFATILNAFYPSDFSIFDKNLLLSVIELDAVKIGGWIVALGIAAAAGLLTSGRSWDIAVIGIILGFVVYLYPIFVYMIDVFTLGMFSYPNYQIHEETPIIMLLIIAIPASAVMFYLMFDLITSALHSSSGGD